MPRKMCLLHILAAGLLAAPLNALDAQPDLAAVFDGSRREADVELLSAPPPPVPPLPGSEWIPADPGGSTGDDNISAPDKDSFWSRLQDKTFDSLCSQAQIPLAGRHRIGSFTEPDGEFNRSLRQLPTGEMAIIDSGKLSVPFGWLPRIGFDRAHLHANFDFFLGARLEGRSTVVRRLKTKKACAQLATLADFRRIKTVLPITGRRIAQMAEGEIWRLPVIFRVGVGALAGDPLYFPLTVNLGAHREGGVTVTLRRLDAQTLRFRLRLEQATLLDAEGKVNANIPVLMFGLPGAENMLLKFVGATVAGALNDFLAVQLDLGAHRRAGVQQALEFIVDPRDPKQTELLARAIRGDLNVLKLMKRTVIGILRRGTPADPWALIEDASEEVKAAGEKPSFAGEDRYRRVHKTFRFHLPILAEYQRVTSEESDRMTLQDRGGGEYVVYRAEKRSRRSFLDIPFLGQFFARDAQKNANVMAHRDAQGKAYGPAVVYVQQEGFLRQDGRDARAMAERANELVRLAGTQGTGTNPKAELPMDQLFPPGSCGRRSCPPPPPGAFWQETEYRRGVAALTIVLNEPAVRQILAASTSALLTAYVNTLAGTARAMAQWLLDHGTAGDRGMSYDHNAAREAARALAETSGVPTWRLLMRLRKSASQVSALAVQLGSANRADGKESQAHALMKLLSAPGRGKLSYGDALRVLIQLANPLDISAEFFVNLMKGGQEERRSRYLLHADARGDKLLDGATQAKARFRQPTELTD